MDEAVSSYKKVILIKNNGSALYFDRLENEDGVYYGILKSKGQTSKIPINPYEIKKVKVISYDKTASTALTMGLILTGVVTVFLIIAIITINNTDFGPTHL